MKTKRFESLIGAVSACVGFVVIVGYRALRVNADDQNRQVKSFYEDGSRKMTSMFATPGVTSEFDGVYIRFPYDSQTGDVEKDRYHHTTCTVGSIISGGLTGDYEITGVFKNEDGKFENYLLAWDWLCPQVPENLIPEYQADRTDFHLKSVQLDRAVKKAKSLGLIEVAHREPPKGDKDKIINPRRNWKLSTLPEVGRMSWASMSNEQLMELIARLGLEIECLATKWAAVMNLAWVEKPEQLFRIIDGGMVESGRFEVIIETRDDPEYVTREEFDRKIAAGQVKFQFDLEDGRRVGKNTSEIDTSVSKKLVIV